MIWAVEASNTGYVQAIEFTMIFSYFKDCFEHIQKKQA